MKEVDMSTEAVERRIKRSSDLRDLALALKRSKPLTAEQAERMREKRRKENLESKSPKSS